MTDPALIAEHDRNLDAVGALWGQFGAALAAVDTSWEALQAGLVEPPPPPPVEPPPPPPPPPVDLAPTVEITAPPSGSTLTGTAAVTIECSDELGRDGLAALVVVDDGAQMAFVGNSWSWDTTGLPDGPHTLAVMVTDPAGHTGGNVITVTTRNAPAPPPPPVLTVTSPVNGATLVGSVQVTADLVSPGGFARAWALIDGTEALADDTTAPIGWTLDTTTLPNGAHTLIVRARDLAMALIESPAVAFTVNNPPPPPPPPPPPTGVVIRDATNTGPAAGTTFTARAGGFNITTAGTVLAGLTISGDVGVLADNVTIRDCKISGGIRVGRGVNGTDKTVRNALIERCEIIGNGDLCGISDVAGVDCVYQLNNIHGYENLMTIWTGTRTQVLFNYMWGDKGGSGAHYDGIEVYGTVGGCAIRGNTILLTKTNGAVAPINVTPVPSCQGTIVIESNLLGSKNTAYVVLCDDSQGSTGIVADIRNNRLWRATPSSSYWSLRHNKSASKYTGTGNIDHLSGAAVQLA